MQAASTKAIPVVFLAVVLGACSSSVVGGGGGAGGSGGGTGAGGAPEGGGEPGSGAGELGECTHETGAGSTGSSALCNGFYACTAGMVSIVCADDGSAQYCDCYLDQELQGSCDDGIDCTFPGSCCEALLDGGAEPEPRRFGECVGGDSAGSSSSGVGSTNCDRRFDCEGGTASITCNGNDQEPATCECRDGTYALLGTCEQPDVSCDDYEGSCCWTILNP